MKETVLYIFAPHQPYRLMVEPWADEFEILLGQNCRLVARHPITAPTFGVETVGGLLIAYVNGLGATYAFWRGDNLEFERNAPIGGNPFDPPAPA
jgi:hypothetical protein